MKAKCLLTHQELRRTNFPTTIRIGDLGIFVSRASILGGVTSPQCASCDELRIGICYLYPKMDSLRVFQDTSSVLPMSTTIEFHKIMRFLTNHPCLIVKLVCRT
jgi:hypothetical protein